MAYHPLELIGLHPRLAPIRVAINNSLEDVHTMLRLPVPQYGLRAGLNHAIVHSLMGVVAGVSIMLFRPDGYSSANFRDLIESFYPLEEEPEEDRPTAERMSEALWNHFRNPFAHSLGFQVDDERGHRRIRIEGIQITVERWVTNEGHSEDFISHLEVGPRPQMSPGLKVRPDEILIQPESFYWGVRRMIERVAKDPEAAARALAFVTTGSSR